jgi:divalent metal cation (Fe/Co/Zn/Cd) transporter
VRAGVRVEYFSLAWMVVEAVASVWAGALAGSLLLIAFGLDSVIELVTGAILLWRLSIEASGGTMERVARAEQRAARVVSVSLVLLCAYVLASAAYGLLTQRRPQSSLPGIVIALVALAVMPGLGLTKRRLAERLGSRALRGDAASSFTCGYMAATVLAGLVLNAVAHWWWAEDVAALVFLGWLGLETREALEEAREGPGAAADHDQRDETE